MSISRYRANRCIAVMQVTAPIELVRRLPCIESLGAVWTAQFPGVAVGSTAEAILSATQRPWPTEAKWAYSGRSINDHQHLSQQVPGDAMRNPRLILVLSAAAVLLAACATTPTGGPMGFFITAREMAPISVAWPEPTRIARSSQPRQVPAVEPGAPTSVPAGPATHRSSMRATASAKVPGSTPRVG